MESGWHSGAFWCTVLQPAAKVSFAERPLHDSSSSVVSVESTFHGAAVQSGCNLLLKCCCLSTPADDFVMLAGGSHTHWDRALQSIWAYAKAHLAATNAAGSKKNYGEVKSSEDPLSFSCHLQVRMPTAQGAVRCPMHNIFVAQLGQVWQMWIRLRFEYAHAGLNLYCLQLFST